MIIYDSVKTLDKSEIKNLSFDNVSYDSAMIAHITRCERIAKALSDEIDRHKAIVKEHEVAFKEHKLISVEHTPTTYFSKEDFISVYGEEEYKRFCTIRERVTVKFGKA